jgi:hypothetical protein
MTKAKKKTVVEEIMEKSGNGFHVRVVNLLRKEKWTVLVSPYYSDNFTDKPREIDIIAERKFDVNSFTDWLGTLNIRLFIECKYVNGDTVFWFDDKDKTRATERIMTDTGMEHPSHNINIKELHYFADVLVAKLFSSKKSRGEDNELVNKAINQNLNSMIYYRNRDDLMPKDPHTRNQVLRRVSYPIIVVNSFEHFFRTSMDDDTGKVEPITEPFQLEVNYAYVDKERSGRNEYFLIDVVSIDKLPEFLAMLEKTDVKAITGKIGWEERQKRTERQSRETGGNNSAR